MRKIAVVNFVTLDGVIQSPADPDEDTSGGFEHGGWVRPYLDEEWGRVAAEGMESGDSLMFGRKTFQKMEAFWPNQPDDDPIAATMNRFTKYVVSNTLDDVAWQPSVVIKGDVAAQISKLKEQPGKTITVLGSGELIKTLMDHDLIDEYKLLLCPIVLGGGKRLFKDGAPKTPLTLVDSKTTGTGAIILRYARSGSS